MAKRKFIRLLSFGLSVMMLVFSLPTAASDTEETTMEATNEAMLEETTEDTVTRSFECTVGEDDAAELQATSNSVQPLATLETYSYQVINSVDVPDGVYALQNIGIPSRWISV